MSAGSNNKAAGVLDFFQDISAAALQERLIALGEIEIVSIYPVGAIHYAWFRQPKRAEPVTNQKPSGKERK